MFCTGRLSYQIGFKFTEHSIESLMQLISNKSDARPDFRKTLLIDGCFSDIGPFKIIELGMISHNKLVLRYTDVQMKRILKEIKRDP